MLVYIGKHPSPKSTRDKANIEYISGGQPSSFKLTFRVELDLNPHSKMILELILDLLKGSHPPYYPCSKHKRVGREGMYWGKPKSHIG